MLDFFAIWVTSPGPALFWTVAGFLLGALVGHYLSLDRDKRKEFNELADPTRNQLRRELGDIRASAQWVSMDTLNLLGDMSHPINRSGFRSAVRAYKEARSQYTERDSYGQSFYTRADHVEKAITTLMARLKRR